MTDKKKSKAKARRGRGEGAVHQRPDGNWQGQLSAGKNPDGTRRRVYVNAPTKTECLALLSTERAKLNSGTLVSADAVTVEGFLLRWMAAIKGSIKASTCESYQRYIDTHIIPAVGSIRLQKLDMFHVETMLANMVRNTRKKPEEHLKRKRWLKRVPQTEQPSANRSKKYARYILVKALDHAIRGNLIVRNVAALVPTPAEQPTKEMTVLEESGVHKLFEQVPGERYGRVYGLSVLTGMREGEYLSLQWADIDFKASPPVLRVRRTQSYANRTVTLEVPKTKSGTRTITLNQAAVDILQDQKRLMLKEGHLAKKFVFVDETGNMLIRSGPVRSCLKRMAKNAGLGNLTPHDLRHTHATLLLRAGVNPKVVSERLGHSDVRVTLKVYSHVLPDTQADVITKLDKLLG